MTAPDRIRERLVDDQGRINTGVARVRCISLARAVVELLEALDELVIRCDGDEGVRADGSNIQTIAAHAIIDRQRSRFDL